MGGRTSTEHHINTRATSDHDEHHSIKWRCRVETHQAVASSMRDLTVFSVMLKRRVA